MHHYRSLDSGLSSPDNFDQEDFSSEVEDPSSGAQSINAEHRNRYNHVLNSTAASQKNSSLIAERGFVNLFKNDFRL